MSGLQIGSVGGSMSFGPEGMTLNGKSLSKLKCPCGNKKSWHTVNSDGKNIKARCGVCNEESTFN